MGAHDKSVPASVRTTFLKGVSIYSAASLLQAIIPILTLPIIARRLSVGDFGFVEAVTIINAFIAVLCSTPVISSFNFFYYKKIKLGGLGSALLTWYAGPGFLLTAASTIVLFYFVNTASFGLGGVYLPFLAVALFLSTQLIGAMTNVMRMSEQPMRCASFTLFSSATINGTATLSCVIIDDYRLTAYFYGILAASFFMAMIGIMLAHNALQKVDRADVNVGNVLTHWKRFSAFGFPLVPAAFAEVALSYFDRIIVLRLAGDEALGEYAMASRVASIVSLGMAGVVMALAPYTLRLIHGASMGVASQRISDVWRYHSLFCLSLCCVLAVTAPGLIWLIGGEIYEPASAVVPWLALSIGLYSFTHYTYLGTLKAERTYLFSLSIIIGVVVIVAVPLIAHSLSSTIEVSHTVAISRVFGVVAIVVLSLYFSQRLYPLQLPLLRVGLQSSITLGFIAFLPLIDTTISQFGLLIFVIILLILFTVRRSEWSFIKTSLFP